MTDPKRLSSEDLDRIEKLGVVWLTEEKLSALCREVRQLQAERDRFADLVRFANDVLDERQKEATQQAAEITEVYGYLSRLLMLVAPQCEPLPRLAGLCTQIDNVLTRLPEQAAEIERLKAEIARCDATNFETLEQLRQFRGRLFAVQRNLPEDAAKVLRDNIWELIGEDRRG